MTDLLRVQGLAIGWGDQVIQQNLNFSVQRGEILAIMGSSGCGKSTLMRHLVGLKQPREGQVLLEGVDIHGGEEQALSQLRRRFGVSFQGGALWSSMTVGENLMLPLRLFTSLSERAMVQVAEYKLALVGLQACFHQAPATLSGGMIKRVAIARSLMLNPELLCLDEPDSGLDPVNAARLDALILSLRQNLGTTVILVTHSVASVFAVADRALFLDELQHTMTAIDTPGQLAAHGPQRVREFLQRAPGP
jgi:phospholipid/cholesterol/gamma-HCH transport system ATP-binding protein